jgi:hypothetical protein
MAVAPVSISPPPGDVHLHGVIYRPDGDHYAIVAIDRNPFDLHSALAIADRSWPVQQLRASYLPGASHHLVIPSSILRIDVGAFAGCHWLRLVDFVSDSCLRELRGFESCGIKCVTIPASVDIIGEGPFAGCLALEIVMFTPDARVTVIHGFSGCGVLEVRLPGSLQWIGPNGFSNCAALRRVTYVRPSLLRLVQGFCGISAHADVHIPACASLDSCAFRGCRTIFFAYEERCLSRMRHDLHRCPRNHASASITGEASASSQQSDLITRSYAQLPLLDLGVGSFQRSLAFRLRVRRAADDVPTTAPVRTRHFTSFDAAENEHRLTLESVLAMFVISGEFCCTVTPQRAQGVHRFDITCRICGEDSSVSLLCPATGRDLTMSTRHRGCGHMFIGRIRPVRGNEASIFVTNPEIGECRYSAEHPIRKISRVLLSGQALDAAHSLLLRSWMTTTRAIRYGVAEPVRRLDSLGFLLNQFPGDFHVYQVPDEERALMLENNGVHILRWVAPWALTVLENADFYELDASFKAIRPYVFCVPLAVRHNVGIPLGLVLGPSETEEMFRMFADALIEKGFDREQLRALPLLSDEGSALRAYARGYHSLHYACFRHWLEGLGSRTLAALLARRLLFTRTRAAYDAIFTQTLSDFVAACHAGEVTQRAERKFAQIFGIVLPLSSNPHVLPITTAGKFLHQALWSARGTAGVSACSNHAEGLHGRLNAVTASHRSAITRLASILQLLQKKVQEYPKKVAKSRHRILADLQKTAKKFHYTQLTDCPSGDVCDHGAILSRRFGCELPCLHTALHQRNIPVPETVPDVNMRGGTDTRATMYAGSWGVAAERSTKSTTPMLLDEASSDPFAEPRQGLEATRFLCQLIREVSLATGTKPFTTEEAHLQFGRIIGRLEVEHPDLSDRERERLAQSQLLIQAWRRH